MPKLKSHSGAKKRFRVTAKGKIKVARAGKRHLQMSPQKPNNRKRKLSRPNTLSAPLEARAHRMLPYGTP